MEVAQTTSKEHSQPLQKGQQLPNKKMSLM